MKKIFRIMCGGIVGVVMLVACDANTPTAGTSEGTAAEVNITDLKIAYIHTDSVINKFDYFKEKSEEIAEKGKRFESELSNRARGFEQEVSNFQQTAGNMTMNQQRAKQEELVTKERNLVSYRDNLMQELSADENQLYNDVYDKIQEYLQQYAKEKDLEMILSYTRGGGVWYADNALDVTESVIKGINENYKKKSGKADTGTSSKEADKPNEEAAPQEDEE